MSSFVNFNNNNITQSPGILSRFQNMSNTFIFGIIAAILLICVGIYYMYNNSAAKPTYAANNENFTANKEAELLLFYAEWCPHCKTAKPIWDDLKSQYENKTINGYTVIFTEINCTQETAEVEQMMNKYHIEGFPTIKLLKDGEIVEYDAKPSKDTLVQFLNSVL